MENGKISLECVCVCARANKFLRQVEGLTMNKFFCVSQWQINSLQQSVPVEKSRIRAINYAVGGILIGVMCKHCSELMLLVALWVGGRGMFYWSHSLDWWKLGIVGQRKKTEIPQELDWVYKSSSCSPQKNLGWSSSLSHKEDEKSRAQLHLTSAQIASWPYTSSTFRFPTATARIVHQFIYADWLYVAKQDIDTGH